MIKQILKTIIVPYYRVLSRDISRNDSVLDVGCGRFSALRHLTFKPRIIVGIELNGEDYRLASESGYYDKVLCEDVRDSLPKFPSKSYDVVLLSDIIEHFNKKDALKIIGEAKRIGHKVIVFTPNGFLEQHEFDGNPLQEHKSGWNIEDLEILGFDCKLIQNFTIKSIYEAYNFTSLRNNFYIPGTTTTSCVVNLGNAYFRPNNCNVFP